jgi:membrane protein required for colicin V production
MLTAFDVGAGVLVLISAILATARGLTREVLSLATWAGSAAIAAYMYLNHRDIAQQYIAESIVADIATVLVSFIVSLIILHLITMRIADFVVDSRIGPLDRTLGFVFGVLRGILICIVVVIFAQFLFRERYPTWVSEAKSLPMLTSLGNSLIQMLPPDLEQFVNDFRQGTIGADEDVDPTDEGVTPPGNTLAPANNTTTQTQT